MIELLAAEMPHHESWVVVVLTHEKQGPETDGPVLEYPVFEVSVDHDDSEINLHTDQEAEKPRPRDEAMTLGALLWELRGLEPRCWEYGVFASSACVSLERMVEYLACWRETDEPIEDWQSRIQRAIPAGDYDGRIDMPLVGTALNPDQRAFGFLRWPPQQWSGAG
ncbi:hypothetical protein ABI59_13780 [Acidobacteria bacterium Mor1]|nr:hypothetical protein ABI59_13780 [Acidobacteria bacterium Mor1]